MTSDFSISREPSVKAYSLDRASIEPVYALDLHAGLSYLDLCAAPGGKSLMATFLTKGEMQMHLNDSSKDRVQRLKAVLHDYLPSPMVGKMRITCSDGSRMGLRARETFDRVLADVPCSAERHHLRDNKIDTWSLKQSKRLAVRQHALLCSALDATVSGGQVVYSTCSLSPLENDGVIRRLMESRNGRFSVIPHRAEMGEATELGTLILPDRFPSYGPIYYSVLSKV